MIPQIVDDMLNIGAASMTEVRKGDGIDFLEVERSKRIVSWLNFSCSGYKHGSHGGPFQLVL